MNEVQFYCSICASSLQSNHVNSMLLVKKNMYLHQCNSTLNFNNLILNLEFFSENIVFFLCFYLKKSQTINGKFPPKCSFTFCTFTCIYTIRDQV